MTMKEQIRDKCTLFLCFFISVSATQQKRNEWLHNIPESAGSLWKNKHGDGYSYFKSRRKYDVTCEGLPERERNEAWDAGREESFISLNVIYTVCSCPDLIGQVVYRALESFTMCFTMSVAQD